MKVLLTGVTGYIGKRLLPDLLEQGHEVVCLVRDPRRFTVNENDIDRVTVLKADLLDKSSLNIIPKDIEIAYYFVHSMGSAGIDFYELENDCANNFVDAMDHTDVKQIIFLSGIINDEKKLSRHLKSRLNVEKILQKAKANTTILRAAIIIGSGSGSFEIIRDLAEKLPIMIAPKWLKTKCQPIAIKNVIEYLIGVLNKTESYNKIFDIGGPDILTYKEMLIKYSEVRGLKRIIITVPVLTPRLSSYWLYFVTSTNFALARSLVDSMKNEVVCEIDGINEILQINLFGYKESIKRAFNMIASNKVASSWIDSVITGNINKNFLDKYKVPEYGCLIDMQRISVNGKAKNVKEKIWTIGGKNGWYFWNWAWELRGLVDKFVGGVGLRRGRRNPADLKPGDALDFWRVIQANEDTGRLILYAEMKLPGEAWLEFDIRNEELIQKATFRPNGILGRLYWYLLLPMHKIIFRGMAHKLAA